MDKLQQGMEKALDRRLSSRSSRTTFRGGRPLVEPLFDVSKSTPIELVDAKLRSRKVIAQLMDAERAWAGQRRAVEAFRMVRTRALHALEAMGGNARVIAVTSPRQGDGKTLIAANLAMGIARQPERKVLLVDADLRLPSIAKLFGLRPKFGFSDYLAGQASLEACMLAAPGGSLFLVPQLRSLPQSSELLANGTLALLADTVRRRHPEWTVILDCPPILAVDDTLIILRTVDSALLVVREGRTRKSEMRRAAEAIGREKYLGAVLNDSRAASDRGHYYYYDYGYEKR